MNNGNNNNENEISKIVQKFIVDKNLKYVSVHEQLNNKDVQNKLKQDTAGLSGVYLILNKVTLEYYIGSASTNHFYTRFYRHLINLSGSKIVKLAVRKQGLENFAFIILELFPEKVTIENNKKLLDLEDFYLKSLLPNYNILTEAGSSFGYKHTEVDRIKMRAVYSEKRRLAVGNLNVNKTLSESTKTRMKESALSISTRIFSKEALSNMNKKSKPIILYNLGSYTIFGEYDSIKHAANSIQCNEKTIIRSLKSDKKVLLNRWFVKYK
jgi:group I intron endonuclease